VLARSAQGVRHGPWPGITRFVRPSKHGEIRSRCVSRRCQFVRLPDASLLVPWPVVAHEFDGLMQWPLPALGTTGACRRPPRYGRRGRLPLSHTRMAAKL
jgi:hypothetical protein